MDRVTDLEIKIAFVERHLAELDEVVRAVHDSVERLQAQVAALAERATNEGEVDPTTRMLEDVPPHY